MKMKNGSKYYSPNDCGCSNCEQNNPENGFWKLYVQKRLGIVKS